MSSVSGTFNSAVQLLVPALQAAATIEILEKQKDQYDDIADERIDLINQAVTNYVTGMDDLITTGLVSDAFGTVPAAAAYVPVNSKDETFNTVNDNLENIPAAERHIAAVNRLNEQDAVVRMMTFSPEYLHIAHRNSASIRDLMHGHLPVGEVVDVLTDQAEQNALKGKIGSGCVNNHRAIGIRRIAMQQLARQEMARQASTINQISPIGRVQSIQDLIQTPAQRIGLALTQAQLIQASLQNANNAAAAGDPSKLGELQILLQKLTSKLANEAQRGNMINQFVPNYAALLQPQINSISQALLGSGQRTGADTGAGGNGGQGQGISYDTPDYEILNQK